MRNGLVSLFALSAAGFLNLYLIRYNETKKGVMITHGGKEYGYSKKAATKAVVSSGLTRVAMASSMMLLVPIFWKGFEVFKLVPKSVKGVAGLDMFILSITLTAIVPLAISLFKQELSISKEKLEPEYKNVKDTKGKIIEQFNFNKGL